ncbi:1a protein [Cassia yellow blotch virus]|uniref:Replication protein 1a n=1 Tax=Cassia yellow blotch virus TaxID=300879 RepID=Q50L56_9BROM|nr:1a protein [Cassia yellow blotch virus]BAD98316.2 1a protein [Cassia yellow blotch virus]
MASLIDLNSLISKKGAESRGVLDIVDNQATQQVLSQVEHLRRSKKINIRNKLAPSEVEAFKARYGGAFDLNLTQEYNAPHSLAGALRIAEHYDCMDSFPPEDRIIDFGGSWWHHYARKDFRVHCCCPILGVRDAARHEERMCRLRRLLQSSDYEETPDFCLNKARDCNVQADWAICIHGGYDMGFKDLCHSMRSHGVRILKGTIMFDGAMLFDESGFLPLLKCRWKKEKGFVKFDFENESTLSYIHSWDKLGSFFTESVYRIGSTTYLLERELIKCNIMTYKIIATDLPCPKETLRHCVWFENLSQYVAVNVPVDFNLCRWRRVRVAVSTVREVEEISFRCFKENKEWTENMKAVASVLSAKSSTVIINGQAIMAGERLSIDDYHLVAFALTLNLYMKYENLRSFHEGLKWGGWWNHFLTRFWWRGDVPTDSRPWLVNLLGQWFPRLRLDTYAESCEFIAKISDVAEFECDSVPSGFLQRFFHSEADLQRRIQVELDTVKDSRDKKKKEKEKASKEPKSEEPVEEVFEEAPDDFIRDDVKPATDGGTVCVDKSTVSRELSLKEYSNYCQRLHENSLSNLRRIWLLAGGKGTVISNKSMLETYHRVDCLINAHIAGSGWLYPTEQEYTIGYNDDGLGPKQAGETFIVDKSCVISNNASLAKASQGLKAPKCSVTLCDGVAGCGKTTAIKNTFSIEKDIIVTANKKSASDVREAIFPEDPEGEIASKFIRTADSALMHGLPSCQRLLIDEAGLLHFGQVLAVAAICKATEVLAFGDSEQISFKSRDNTFRFRHQKIIYDRRDVVTVTYRCPQDVVAAVVKMKRRTGKLRESKYSSWISRSKVEKSLSARPISSLNQIVIEPHKFYQTMTQSAKAALMTRAKDFQLPKSWIEANIKTAHESQGISVDHVVHVRDKSTKCDLYKDEEYCLVAMTRHKKTFEYCYNGELAGDLLLHSIRS